MTDGDLASATGLAIATIAKLIERNDPISQGEVSRCLSLLADAGSSDRPGQQTILRQWAELSATIDKPN